MDKCMVIDLSTKYSIQSETKVILQQNNQPYVKLCDISDDKGKTK